MKRMLISLVLLGIAIAPGQKVAAGLWQNEGPTFPARLTMHSEPFDSIGAGQNYVYTPADGAFSFSAADLNGDGQSDAVSVFFLGNFTPRGLDFWGLDFVSFGEGTNLVPGSFFNRAERGGPAGHPGLDVFGNGRGCNSLSGKFAILDLKVDNSMPTPQVLSFAAQFEQHCEGSSPALFGTIHFNYMPTVTVTLSQSSAAGGQTISGSVKLTNPAPPGGAMVTLKSSSPGLASVPDALLIPEGQSTASFTVNTNVVKARPFVTILATYAGVANAANLTVSFPFPSTTLLSVRERTLLGDFDTLFTTANSSFFPSTPFSAGDVPASLRFLVNGSGFAFATFSTGTQGRPLQPGFYPNASNGFGTPPGVPVLDVSGVFGCAGSGGSFTVREANFDDSFSPPLLVSFAGEFEQTCSGGPNLLIGRLLYKFSDTAPSSDFDTCIQDKVTRDRIEINSATGEYKITLCLRGTVIQGVGRVRVVNGVVTLLDSSADRSVQASVDIGARTGTARITIVKPRLNIAIDDRNTGDSCDCT